MPTTAILQSVPDIDLNHIGPFLHDVFCLSRVYTSAALPILREDQTFDMVTQLMLGDKFSRTSLDIRIVTLRAINEFVDYVSQTKGKIL